MRHFTFEAATEEDNFAACHSNTRIYTFACIPLHVRILIHVWKKATCICMQLRIDSHTFRRLNPLQGASSPRLNQGSGEGGTLLTEGWLIG